MENKFSIGDRVRIKADEIKHNVSSEKGDLGEIVGIAYNGYVRVLFDDRVKGCTFVDSNDLELAEPYDPKTAFLSDLAAVLRKHNAVINVGWNGNHSDGYPCIDVNIQFENSNRAACLEDVLNWSITADNIMDYDKE